MWMWRWIRKRLAVRSYRTALATRLRERYGRERAYTPEQVASCAVDAGVSTMFLCFAFAMFCDRASFDAFHAARGEACDYDGMRGELAPAIGVDHATFDATDVIDRFDHGGGDTSFDHGGHDTGHGHHDHHDHGWFDGFDDFDGGCSSD